MQTPHNSETVLTRPALPADARLIYGNDPNQFGELRLPPGGNAKGLVVNIHGGYWRARYDLKHAGHLCAALTQAGIVTWNVEYRRVGNEGGGWPGSFEDVTNALLYIHQITRERSLAVDKVVVVGHSAGGQLALCLAAHQPWLRGVVSLAAVTDMRRAHELKMSNDAAADFLGGTPENVADHYREASPIETPIAVPQRIVHGTRDNIVPLEMATKYAERKKRAHEKVELITLPGDHFDVIDPLSAVWPTVAKTILALLK